MGRHEADEQNGFVAQGPTGQYQPVAGLSHWRDIGMPPQLSNRVPQPSEEQPEQYYQEPPLSNPDYESTAWHSGHKETWDRFENHDHYVAIDRRYKNRMRWSILSLVTGSLITASSVACEVALFFRR